MVGRQTRIAGLSQSTEIANSANGTPAVIVALDRPGDACGIMPGREIAMTEEERWHVVNYVRTLGKEKTE